MFFISLLLGLWLTVFPTDDGVVAKPYSPCGDGVYATGKLTQSTPPGCRS